MNFQMNTDFACGIVAILNSLGVPVGAGFLAAEPYLLTCSHTLVRLGLEENHIVKIFFQANASEGKARIVDLDKETDIAILKVIGPCPPDAQPLLMEDGRSSSGNAFSTFGYPNIAKRSPSSQSKIILGDFTDGQIKGIVTQSADGKRMPVLQLEGGDIDPGYSGAPAWDAARKHVIGMISMAFMLTRSSTTGGTGYAILGETLQKSLEDFIKITPRIPVIGVPLSNPNIYPYRENETEQIRQGFARGNKIIVAGIGGTGKTQLVKAYLDQDESLYPQGIFWIDAVTNWVSEFEQLARIARRDGLIQVNSEHQLELAGALLDYLQGAEKAILVFDHIQDLEMLAQPFLKRPPLNRMRCRMILTARLQEAPEDFQLIKLGALDPLSSYKLLVSQSGNIPGSKKEEKEVETIAAQMGYLPLALSMAAAYMEKEKTSFTDYKHILNSKGSYKTVTTKAPGKLDRVFQNQWDGLPSDLERMVLKVAADLSSLGHSISLERLSRFTGLPIDRPSPEAMQRLTGVLDTLLAYSLIEPYSVESLRLNPLVREFVEMQAFNEGQRKKLVKLNQKILALETSSPFERKQAAIFLTHLHWFDFVSLEALPTEEMIDYLETVKNNLRHSDELTYVLQNGIEPFLEVKAGLLSKREEAKLLIDSGTYHAYLGFLEKALKKYRQANQVLEEIFTRGPAALEDYRLKARGLLGNANLQRNLYCIEDNESGDMSISYGHEGDVAQAIPLYQSAAKAALTYGADTILLVFIYKELSFTYTLLGELQKAELAYQDGITALKDHLLAYNSLLEAGSQVYEKRARRENAQANYQEALHLTLEGISILERAIGDCEELSIGYDNAATLLSKQDPSEEDKNIQEQVMAYKNKAIEVDYRLEHRFDEPGE